MTSSTWGSGSVVRSRRTSLNWPGHKFQFCAASEIAIAPVSPVFGPVFALVAKRSNFFHFISPPFSESLVTTSRDRISNDRQQHFKAGTEIGFRGRLYSRFPVGLKRADSASWDLRICMSCIRSFRLNSFLETGVTLFSRLHLFLEKKITPSSIRESVCVHEIGIRLPLRTSFPHIFSGPWSEIKVGYGFI